MTDRIKQAKKTNSVVPGDIFPSLYKHFPFELAKPIAAIFNRIVEVFDWPQQWKKEYVTVIRKGHDPSDPSQCRNISCTNFMSKFFESFVLTWSRSEVAPKLNQYGGEPGASSAYG